MALKSSNKVDTNTYEIEVTVAPEVFADACKSAYMKQRKSIQLPGFRKGKATQGMIEKVYGEGAFYEEALEIVYPKVVSEAIEEAGLRTVDQPFDLDVPVMSKAEGVEMKMKVTVYPEVKLGDYKGLKATMLPTEASDEDVDTELENMRDRNSRLVSVDDREAQMGDTAEIDFEGFVDGVAFDGGKDAVFKCKIHEIKTKEMPELDDEFVKDVSEFDTLDELKADIKKNLSEKKEADAKADFENQLIEQVVENMECEIPECMFESRTNEMVQDYSYRLQMQGIDLNTYLSYMGQDMDTFKKTFREGAENQVKASIALEAIVAAENIEVTDEEIDAEVAKLADQYKMEADQIKAAVPADQLASDIKTRKALDLVVESAVKA